MRNEKCFKGEIKWLVRVLTVLVIYHLSLIIVSCSETDDEETSMEEWRMTNEKYFEQQYQTHSIKYVNWSLPSSKSVNEVEHTDCILVDVLEEGSGTATPYYTDSVLVHYSGRLIPTDDAPGGYEFDCSWVNSLDTDIDVPSQFGVNSGLVDGFCTALQHMHKGDHWRVIVPYQLGYGSSSSSSGLIPSYSTLIFDLYMVDFWSKTRGDREE